MTDHDQADEGIFEDWDLTDEDFEPLPTPPWRRPLLILIACLTVLAMAAVPVYNLFSTPDVAENGLEICGFDYCIVQDAVQEAGVDLTMSSLSNTLLDEEEARSLAADLTDHLGIRPVGLVVVDDLEGRLGGVYESSERLISIERPARAWTVLHEVAHAVEGGHGDAFQRVVIDLALWMESRGG